LAVPDQSLSLAQIVKAHVRGTPINIKSREPLYLGDDVVYPHDIDNIDAQDMLQAVQNEVNAIRTDFQQKRLYRKQQQQQQQQTPQKLEIKKDDAAAGDVKASGKKEQSDE